MVRLINILKIKIERLYYAHQIQTLFPSSMADEDDEESVHVVLNFKEPPKLAPGTSFRLNLDDETPVLELPDGTKFIGKFEETIGTQMIFEGMFNQLLHDMTSSLIAIMAYTFSHLVLTIPRVPPFPSSSYFR